MPSMIKFKKGHVVEVEDKPERRGVLVHKLVKYGYHFSDFKGERWMIDWFNGKTSIEYEGDLKLWCNGTRRSKLCNVCHDRFICFTER